jgi:hypothetical protein
MDSPTNGPSMFGVLLEHSALANVRSIQDLTEVVAVPAFENVPEEVTMWVRDSEE